MKCKTITSIAVLAVFLIVGCMSTISYAQNAEMEEAMKKDKTGTNPLNFSFDARLYN